MPQGRLRPCPPEGPTRVPQHGKRQNTALRCGIPPAPEKKDRSPGKLKTGQIFETRHENLHMPFHVDSVVVPEFRPCHGNRGLHDLRRYFCDGCRLHRNHRSASGWKDMVAGKSRTAENSPGKSFARIDFKDGPNRKTC